MADESWRWRWPERGTVMENREYAETYDPRWERKFTNKPEAAEDIRARLQLQELAEQEARDAQNAQSAVHYWPDVGKFIIPEENTWAAHAALVKNHDTALYFNPWKYLYFDKLIAEKFPDKALYDVADPNYLHYEGLRNNIAALRNDIIGIYLKDGSYDPGDQVHVPTIQAIASAIGDALANDTWLKRPFTKSFSRDLANVEGRGAAEIYKYLLEIQQQPGMFDSVINPINDALNIPNRNWGLPPLEETPFSDANLQAAPPQSRASAPARTTAPAEPPAQPSISAAPAQPAEAPLSDSEKLSIVSEHTVGICNGLCSVERLSHAAKATSVDEARKILRWLKNLQHTDRDIEDWLDLGTPGEQLAKAEALDYLVSLYSGQLAQAVAKDPAVIQLHAVEDANNAAGTVGMALALQALHSLPDHHPDIARLEQLIDAMPDAWELGQAQSVDRLIETIEHGMNSLAGKHVGDKTPADRLVEMSQRIQATAKRLRSVDSLEPPVKAQSVELMREVLRRLKLVFAASDKPLDGLKAEDSAGIAEKLHEMVSIYQNLLAEAVQANPELLQDRRIQEANDAVSSFSHGVSLLAAKEMPNSLAATQQISAEAAQNPEKVQQLDGHMASRLVQSLEGAVEQLAQQQQEQQQQQDEELAQDIIDASLNDSQKRKKRKGRGKGSASLKKSAKRRNAGDLNGDGVADKLQGLNIGGNINKPLEKPINLGASAIAAPKVFNGLKAEDMAVIKQLGGSLRDIGKQLKDINAGLANVTATDKIAADDKTFAVRNAERDQQQGPRGQGPRLS